MTLDELRDIIIKYLYRYSISKIGISDILEIIILGVIVYQVIKWLHFTRAWTLFKGIFVILVFAMVAVIFQLDTITWLLSNSLSVAIIAVVVIFQPELRRVLEQLGRRNMIRLFISSSDEYSDDSKVISEKTITEIIKASFEMGKARTGALMVIEQSVALGEYERTGITVDGVVTNQLLINIFEHNTPLHDGAVIIRGNRIVSATCYLPLTDSMELGKELGTRHRAAVGISEVSDSTTVVVSEETGAVSVTKDGILYPNLNREELEEKLEHLKQGNSEGRDVFRKWKGLLHNERNEKQ